MNSRTDLVRVRQVVTWRLVLALALLVLLAFTSGIGLTARTAQASDPGTCTLAGGVKTCTGTIDGAAYKIEVPVNWNRTLVLYSHGYVAPGSANNATDVGDPVTGAYLLGHGYALAGSSYSTTGWALEQAFHDQIALLNFFGDTIGHPRRTIAWGHSLGGIITAGLVQKFPNRFDAALPMCGVLSGGVGTWNQALDAAFVFKTLLAPGSDLKLVNMGFPNSANLNLAETILAAAQGSAQGRARLALVAAMGDTPGWFDSTAPEPAQNDYAAREYNQFLWSQQVNFPFVFLLRGELEARAGGNPSWNTGVDYEEQLEKSINRDEVVALYKQAGLNLKDDLDTLEHTPRIKADPNAVNYLTRNIVFDGQIDIPVLTLHTTGDGLVVVQNEQSYDKAVSEADNERLLRQTYVHRAGHCTFTPAETITAFNTLLHRLNNGWWDDSTNPDLLNNAASALGAQYNILFANGSVVPTAPAYLRFKVSPFLRPYFLHRFPHRDFVSDM
jgi:pimeloyl-ACP methyl ester carboxylesterase